jgi:hypothetical protein
MAYADRQHGKTNGSWIARVRLVGKRFKRSFVDWDEAEETSAMCAGMARSLRASWRLA